MVASTSIYHNPIHSYCQETLSKLNYFHQELFPKTRGNVFLHLCAFCQGQKRYGPYQLAQLYRGEINTGNKQAILERGYSTQKYFKRLISSPPSPLRTLWVLLQQTSKDQVDKGSKHTAGSTLVSHSEWKQNSDLRTIQNHTGSLRCILSGFFLWRKCLSSAFLSHSSLRQHQKLEWSLHVAHCLNASNFHPVLKWPRSSCMLN